MVPVIEKEEKMLPRNDYLKNAEMWLRLKEFDKSFGYLKLAPLR